MSNAITWRAEDLSSPNGAQASNLLREETLDSRLSSLREVALTLLDALESLKSVEQPRAERKLRLQDEVQRFEADLIRAALVRTGGNQAGAARLLGVKHTTLNSKIKRYRIPLVAHQAEADNSEGDQEIAA
jgi:transcriptional regulator with GAF, ATPase, and Fis domain